MELIRSTTLLTCLVQLFYVAFTAQVETNDPSDRDRSFDERNAINDLLTENDKREEPKDKTITDLREEVKLLREQLEGMGQGDIAEQSEPTDAQAENGTLSGKDAQQRKGLPSDPLAGSEDNAESRDSRNRRSVRYVVRRPTHGGVTYIRWGRSGCPSGTNRIYKGYAAGNAYSQYGGGSNYLCLPENPEWDSPATAFNQYYPKIYGVEYEMSAKDPPYYRELMNYDAPCALCHSPRRSTTMTLPARKSCPYGWNREYQGYLVTEYYGHNNKDYICLDKNPEIANNGRHVNDNGALFYPVEVACGSLPCHTYPNGREVACAVCTR